jgi:hypothetical protein
MTKQSITNLLLRSSSESATLVVSKSLLKMDDSSQLSSTGALYRLLLLRCAENIDTKVYKTWIEELVRLRVKSIEKCVSKLYTYV